MPAYTEEATTQAFADLIVEMSEDAGRDDVIVTPAEDCGWMMPDGEALVVDAAGAEYLITVRKVG